MRHHEVVVVGAGPAGSAAAMRLAASGRDVLLLDREDFPRDKACGDYVPGAAMDLLGRLGMREAFDRPDVHGVETVRVLAPSGRALDIRVKARRGRASSCIVPRTVFDSLLVTHARALGARFEVARVEAPLLDGGRVVGVRASNGSRTGTDDAVEIRADAVIAADGATSTIARALRPGASLPAHRAVALRAYVEDFDIADHVAEIHYVKSLLPGYGWLFSMGQGRANIGVGMRLDHFRARHTTLKNVLEAFVALPAISARMRSGAAPTDILVWQLNFASERFPRVWDGALLIGDAGGFINPLTGGGIQNALITAVAAADTVNRALDAGVADRRALSRFERVWRRRIGLRLRAGHLAQRLLVSNPGRVDLAASVLGRLPAFQPAVS